MSTALPPFALCAAIDTGPSGRTRNAASEGVPSTKAAAATAAPGKPAGERREQRRGKGEREAQRGAESEGGQETTRLRCEMHRLLYQEEKLARARQQLAQDEAELAGRHGATGRTQNEIQQLRAQGGEQQQQLSMQVAQKEAELVKKREELAAAKLSLQDVARRFELLQAELREKLHRKERELADLQAQNTAMEERLTRRKAEHPQEALSLRTRIEDAQADSERYFAAAASYKKQLHALQEKHCMTLRP